jgi:hypothetical protein
MKKHREEDEEDKKRENSNVSTLCQAVSYMKEDSRTYRDGVGGEVGNGQRKRKNTEKI